MWSLSANGSVLGRPSLVIAFAVMFSSFVVPNGAPDHSAGNAMTTCVVAGGSADNSSFNATSCLCGVGHGCHGKSQNGANAKDSHFDTLFLFCG